MFNLEKAIADWRRQMLRAGVDNLAHLDELEGHLREEISEQAKSGMGELECFQRAGEKIGPTRLVQQEFKKVKTADREWKLSEIGMAALSIVLPLKVGRDLISKGGGLTHDQQLSGLAAVTVFLLLFWGGRLSYRVLPVIPGRRIRSLALAAGFALIGIWTRILLTDIVPRLDYTTSQTTVAFIWGWMTPMGAVAGIYWGVETAARKKVLVADS